MRLEELDENFMNMKPDNWPVNSREEKLELIFRKIKQFELSPSYITRERLIACVCDDDLNQFASGIGLVRVTNFEVELINYIYLRAERLQINSIKVYLYNLIAETIRLQKNIYYNSFLFDSESNFSYKIEEYETNLLTPMLLYYSAYQKYTIEKSKEFADQLIELVQDSLAKNSDAEYVSRLTFAYGKLLMDLSYMRGTKKEKILEFTREELYRLFKLEAYLYKLVKIDIYQRPVKGILKIQISNYILKSRNGYNDDYICKYLSSSVAKESVDNCEIWMRKVTDLNDKREQKVVPELFQETSWISYQWAHGFNFTPQRKYFVSSFSKSINNVNMQSDYGECIYGYKNDKIIDLIGPIMKQEFSKENEDGTKELICLPGISQVIAFDVIYDKEEVKKELEFLFSIIDLFYISDDKKHLFAEEILQYWILSVKDTKWQKERERRYVIFMYDDYEYLETTIEDDFLKIKTSLFIVPDFILGNNPVRETLRLQIENKQRSLMSREYFHCKNCFLQNYDLAIYEMPSICPICGSSQVEIIYPKSLS